MRNKKETGADDYGTNPQNLKNLKRDFDRLFNSNYDGVEEKIQGKVAELICPAGRIIKLYRCSGCGRDKPEKRFSRCRIVCRECFSECRTKGKVAFRNFHERVLNNVDRYLRGSLI